MQRYFVEPANIIDNEVTIQGSDVHHIRNVMRFSIGDSLGICPNDGTLRLARITAIEKSKVTAAIFKTIIENQPEHKITIAQALIRKDRFEWFLEKATELGVTKIIPTRFARSIVQIDENKSTAKLERYRMIVKEASEQSERNVMPLITAFTDLPDIDYSRYDMIFYASERDQKASLIRDVLAKHLKSGKYLFLVGPEGGITDDEVSLLEAKGAIPISLGSRILRSETAGIMVMSAILSQWGE
jgi:16S rRNA (uracil1498-N3)-methyltransferase